MYRFQPCPLLKIAVLVYPCDKLCCVNNLLNDLPSISGRYPEKVTLLPTIYMLLAGQEVRIGKNFAVLKTSGTAFPNTDRPWPANNVFISFSSVEYFASSFCVEFLLQPFSNLVYACV